MRAPGRSGRNLNDDELLELQRLLKEELAKS